MKRKFPQGLLLLAFFVSSISSFSQNSINVSLHHDFKLLVFGDDLGNRAGTLDLLTRVKYETADNQIGFYNFGIEYERAFITDPYNRFGAFTGFTFLDVFNDYNFQVTPIVGLGMIHRFDKNLFSFSGSLQFEYLLGERVILSMLNQFTQRTDLEYRYDKLEYRYSFFLGVEVKLFDLKKD